MIHFGTSGWRGMMGEDFTFENVRVVVQAIAEFLGRKFPGREIAVIVNYDTRFLSERYATEAAKILSHNRIRVLLTERDAPSQAQAFQIIKRGVQGGINFTASFNPPRYNGLKYNTERGAPAMPAETDVIEEAKFKTFGCGSAIASSSLATEWIKGMTVEQAMELKNTQIVEELNLPPVKIHCSVLAEDAVKQAIADYKAKKAKRKSAAVG